MSKEEFIEKIKEIKINIPNEEFFLEYNKEIYNILEEKEQLEQENKKLKENIEDYERIFDIWNKRKLIKKFNKEFSKKKVKEERAKGNKIVGVIPDAEYVYKKYYEKVEQLDLYKSFIEEAKEKSIFLQERYGYILDDLTFILMRVGSDNNE